uniref:DSPc domain-containing protein n=1 Tax=Macrostomum lignano TaxID=282301 RepID=A0A1I8FL68_9PLAT
LWLGGRNAAKNAQVLRSRRSGGRLSQRASVVIAYLMQSQQLAFQSPYDLVKAGACLSWDQNDGFVRQLLSSV